MAGKKPRRRRSFSREFKPEVVALVRQPGRTAGSVARELELTETAVREWVPRLAHRADHRLWVIDAHPDYGPLQALAGHRTNRSLIADQWDQICRLTASLEARTVTPSPIVRSLQRGPSPSSLGRALAELGRIVKGRAPGGGLRPLRTVG